MLLALRFAAALALGGFLAALDPRGLDNDAREDYLKRKYEFQLHASQRHLELGLWCREKGLVAQATQELLRAEELSEGKNPGVGMVLSYMRNLDDAFWKKRKRPGSSTMESYVPKARRLEKQDDQERCEIAAWAWGRKLERDARADYEELIWESDAPLVLDERGRIVLAGGTIPPELSSQFKSEAVLINGRLYLRDKFLQQIPEIDSVQETDSATLRVRGTAKPEVLADLHALGTALCAILAEDLGARPLRKLNAFVFTERRGFEAYLDAVGLPDQKAGDGFADLATLTAVVCAEEKSEEDVRSSLLHELTHLYSFGISRAVMPSWYAEGLAETYGGQGTFQWRDGVLKTGGTLADFRLEPLRKEQRFSVRDLLDEDALAVLNRDRALGLQFYSQSWAFVRYLRDHTKYHARFEEWEFVCTGAALGAARGNPLSRNSTQARAQFFKVFGEELEAMEKDYAQFLAQL
jgi:hypothetical protein